MRNSNSQSTVSFGTFDITADSDDVTPATATYWSNLLLISRNVLIHWRFLPLIPQCSSFSNNFWRHTLSNALLKSSSMLSTCSPWFIDFTRSFTVLIICVSQHRYFLKSCCRSVRMLLFSKCVILLCNVYSKTLTWDGR